MMKVVNSYIFRSICSLLVGILLVANPEQMSELLVQLMGGLFAFSGLVSLINYLLIYFSKKVVVKPMFPVVGVGSLLFGLMLGFFPSLFIAYLMFMLGILLVLAGINQIWTQFSFRSMVPFRWYSFIMALLILGAGLFVLFKPLATAALPFVVLGYTFVVYGVAELVAGVRWRKYERMHRNLNDPLPPVDEIPEAEVVEEHKD